ncbi:hypothetical protein [Chondromyces apiculatus]|nr:hypothetical protein [Chondromyces apiculatus]
MRLSLSSLLVFTLLAACSSDPGPSSTGGGGQGQGGQGGGQGGHAGHAGGSGGGSGGEGGGVTVSPPPYDVVGIVGTGQSLSVGVSGNPVLSTTQPYGNLKLDDAGSDPKYDGQGDVLSLVPLTEPVRGGLTGLPAGPYPNNIFGETIHAGMANQLSATAMEHGFDYTSAHTVIGESGQSITVIEKNGTGKAYAATLYEVEAIKALTAAAGQSYGVAAITLTHGETDTADPTYAAQIHQLWADYNTDLPAITGQTAPIPMLVTQQSTFPGQAGARSVSTVAQWRLGLDYPGEILCVGPKYQYGYAGDRVHLDAPGYVRLGEKNAEVLARISLLNQTWKPLQPRAMSRNGATITLDFDVPDPPLAWEETITPPHQVANTAWANGRGFEVEDTTGPLTIASVAIEGLAVKITLAAPPAGQNLVVRYAMTQDVDGFTGGTADARRGQLRDSDPFEGQSKQTVMSTVTSGSAQITGPAGAFAARAVGDLVSGGGLPEGTVVLTKASNEALVLSQPFPGASGAADLTFHHDHRNYCVQFEMAE